MVCFQEDFVESARVAASLIIIWTKEDVGADHPFLLGVVDVDPNKRQEVCERSVMQVCVFLSEIHLQLDNGGPIPSTSYCGHDQVSCATECNCFLWEFLCQRC